MARRRRAFFIIKGTFLNSEAPAREGERCRAPGGRRGGQGALGAEVAGVGHGSWGLRAPGSAERCGGGCRWALPQRGRARPGALDAVHHSRCTALPGGRPWAAAAAGGSPQPRSHVTNQRVRARDPLTPLPERLARPTGQNAPHTP